MRARPREVNIFNMSLLDILCGALGAFCFMMLVALPYYHPGSLSEKKTREDVDSLLRELDRLRQNVNDPTISEDLRQKLAELDALVKQLSGEVNRLANENARLTSDNEAATKALNSMMEKLNAAEAENETLQQENLENKIALAIKRPFAVIAVTDDPQQPIDLYLERTSFLVLGAKYEKFNPAEPFHRSPEADDLNGWYPERGVNFWVNATTKPGSGYRVFVKYLGEKKLERDSSVRLRFFGNSAEAPPTPPINLSRARPWVLAGMVNIDQKGELSFKEATAAERDEAWRQITKTEPPTPTPSANPAPPRTLTPEDMERLRKKAEEQQRQQGGGAKPTATASAERGSDQAARALREREERAHAARTPAPSASAAPSP